MVARAFAQTRNCGCGDRLSFTQDDGVGAHPLHLFQIVRGQDDRRMLGQSGDEPEDGPPARGIQGRRRLVEDDEVGIADQRLRKA